MGNAEISPGYYFGAREGGCLGAALSIVKEWNGFTIASYVGSLAG